MGIFQNQSKVVVGKFFRLKRMEKGLSQEKLAESLKFAPKFVSNYERGECFPPEKHLSPLLLSLNIEREEFLEFLLDENTKNWKIILEPNSC